MSNKHLLYKCRSFRDPSDYEKIRQILSGKYKIIPKYLRETLAIDNEAGVATVSTRTPTGMLTVKCEYKEHPKSEVLAPGFINITMPPGCLWHSTPQYFEDQFDVNPSFQTRMNIDALKPLLNPKIAPLISIYGTEHFDDIAEANCSDILKKIREIGICSLSRSFHEKRLWKKYGDNGHGIAIEFEIDNIDGGSFRIVEYVKGRPKVDINDMLRIATGNCENEQESMMGLLSQKTLEWQFEDEVRHISGLANQYAYVAPIRRVLFGPNVPSHSKLALERKFPDIEFSETKIRDNKITEYHHAVITRTSDLDDPINSNPKEQNASPNL